MCHFVSGLLLEDGTVFINPGRDSHTLLFPTLNIDDHPRNAVRLEYVPTREAIEALTKWRDGADRAHDWDQWRFIVDQDMRPDWFDMDQAMHAMRSAINRLTVWGDHGRVPKKCQLLFAIGCGWDEVPKGTYIGHMIQPVYGGLTIKGCIDHLSGDRDSKPAVYAISDSAYIKIIDGCRVESINGRIATIANSEIYNIERGAHVTTVVDSTVQILRGCRIESVRASQVEQATDFAVIDSLADGSTLRALSGFSIVATGSNNVHIEDVGRHCRVGAPSWGDYYGQIGRIHATARAIMRAPCVSPDVEVYGLPSAI
ncbi:MAG: hypothetical protein IPO08_20060 [Xanthomonadales bacterium]|nr:hypothetical protein [Xanthomonadales bacterium]